MVFAAARWPGVMQEPLLFMEGGEVAGGCLVMVKPLPLRLGAVAKWAAGERDVPCGPPP